MLHLIKCTLYAGVKWTFDTIELIIDNVAQDSSTSSYENDAITHFMSLAAEKKNTTMNWIKVNDPNAYNNALTDPRAVADGSNTSTDKHFKWWWILSTSGTESVKSIVNIIAPGPPTCLAAGGLAALTLLSILAFTLCSLIC